MGRRMLISDQFDRADNVDLGPEWDGGYFDSPNTLPNLAIVGNRVRATSTTNDCCESYNKLALGGDQWAEMRLATVAGASVKGPRLMLRMAAVPLFSGYEFVANIDGTPTSRIARLDDGTRVTLDSHNTVTWGQGDILRAEMVGARLSLYRNNGAVPVLEAEDTRYQGGRPGLLIFSAVLADCEVDGWLVGDFFDERHELADFPKHKHREAALLRQI